MAAVLAGNYFKLPIFLTINFLFGCIFAMLALQFFGVGRGILAAAINYCFRHEGRDFRVGSLQEFRGRVAQFELSQ